MIELKHVSWSTADGKEVLKDINLVIDSDCLVAISGPNGGGKTTLAKILMGIEKPTSGKIYFNGLDITNFDVTARANLGISFGFQEPVRFKGISVRKMLNIAAGKKLEETYLHNLLQEVGLCAKKYLDRDIDSTLSGGEIKRIEIATVLARNSDVIIFDEPEAGIDLWSFESLINVFEKMREEKSRSLIVISHQERILSIADEIIVIAEGKIVDKGEGKIVLERMIAGNHRLVRPCGRTEVVINE